MLPDSSRNLIIAIGIYREWNLSMCRNRLSKAANQLLTIAFSKVCLCESFVPRRNVTGFAVTLVVTFSETDSV